MRKIFCEMSLNRGWRGTFIFSRCQVNQLSSFDSRMEWKLWVLPEPEKVFELNNFIKNISQICWSFSSSLSKRPEWSQAPHITLNLAKFSITRRTMDVEGAFEKKKLATEAQRAKNWSKLNENVFDGGWVGALIKKSSKEFHKRLFWGKKSSSYWKSPTTTCNKLKILNCCLSAWIFLFFHVQEFKLQRKFSKWKLGKVLIDCEASDEVGNNVDSRSWSCNTNLGMKTDLDEVFQSFLCFGSWRDIEILRMLLIS